MRTVSLYTCSIFIYAGYMVLLCEYVEYMHDDYETINSRGLEALKKTILFQFDCKRTVYIDGGAVEKQLYIC